MNILLRIVQSLKRGEDRFDPRDPLARLSLDEQADVPPWHEPRPNGPATCGCSGRC